MANEKRLIYAEDLVKTIVNTPSEVANMYTYNVLNSLVDRTNEILNLIDKAPTVDAVEVVRCRDCKLYMTINCTCDGCCISDDWYCADGERKEVPEDV